MTEEHCDFCGDPLDANAIRRSDKVYCCEACAFEASRSINCGVLADPPHPLIASESDSQQDNGS